MARDADGDQLSYRWTIAGERMETAASVARLSGAVSGASARWSWWSRTATVARRASRWSWCWAGCELPDGAIPNEAGDRAYLVERISDTYDAHRYEAARRGGHLATLTSQAELDFVRSLDGEGWIGLWSPRQDHVFETVTGEPADFQPFCPASPTTLPATSSRCSSGTSTASTTTRAAARRWVSTSSSCRASRRMSARGRR
ncbi:MAG: C-type lectin domain-containing protein [bacterium]